MLKRKLYPYIFHILLKSFHIIRQKIKQQYLFNHLLRPASLCITGAKEDILMLKSIIGKPCTAAIIHLETAILIPLLVSVILLVFSRIKASIMRQKQSIDRP